MRNRALLLVAGLISASVYMTVTLRLPWWSYGGTLQSWACLLGDGREAFGLSIAGLGVLMVAYLWGWQIVHSGRGKRWMIWGFAGLFAATLFWLMPMTSDLFAYLRKHARSFDGTALLLTAAYCRDKKKGRPMGSGERDLVRFAGKHRINLGLLPYRSGDILTKGISDERKRVEEYERILSEAGYIVRRHSTKALFQGQNAPDWFFLDVLTAKRNE